MPELRLDRMETQDAEEETAQGLGLGAGRGEAGRERRRSRQEEVSPGAPRVTSCHFLLLPPQHGSLNPMLHHTCRPSHDWASSRSPSPLLTSGNALTLQDPVLLRACPWPCLPGAPVPL